MNKDKKFNLVLGGLVIAMVVIYFAFGSGRGKNPALVTKERLDALQVEVEKWAEKNGGPPAQLSELQVEEDLLTDHMGVPFIYEVNGSEVVITSYGADGKPGGFMFKADRKVMFDTASE